MFAGRAEIKDDKSIHDFLQSPEPDGWYHLYIVHGGDDRGEKTSKKKSKKKMQLQQQPLLQQQAQPLLQLKAQHHWYHQQLQALLPLQTMLPPHFKQWSHHQREVERNFGRMNAKSVAPRLISTQASSNFQNQNRKM